MPHFLPNVCFFLWQMDQYNETINSTCLSNGMINKNFSDGHVTEQFIRGLVNKENIRPTQLSSETFIVEKAPKFDETVIKDNPTKSIQSSRRKPPDQKGDLMRQNSPEVTATKFQTEKEDRTLPKENSNENDSDMDDDDRSLVSLLNRVPVDGVSIAPSDSASCISAPTCNPVTNQKGQPQRNFSPPASQSSVCSDGFDNDSIVPITKNKRKITPEEHQKRIPSSSQIRYKPVLQARKPDKRKSESPPPSPRKRRRWSYEEDVLLTKGFQKYKNDKIIWTMIKNKFFANSTRTNVNLKDRARTLGLK